MEDKKINSQESIELIEKMLQETKNSQVKSVPYLISGLLLLIGTIALTVLYAIKTDTAIMQRLTIGFYWVCQIALFAYYVYVNVQHHKDGYALSSIEKISHVMGVCLGGFSFSALLYFTLSLFMTGSANIQALNLILAGLLTLGGILSTNMQSEYSILLSMVNYCSYFVFTCLLLMPFLLHFDADGAIGASYVTLAFSVFMVLWVPGTYQMRKNNEKKLLK